jgi:hypothetical protein
MRESDARDRVAELLEEVAAVPWPLAAAVMVAAAATVALALSWVGAVAALAVAPPAVKPVSISQSHEEDGR